MDAEKWGEILDRVKAQFEAVEHSKALGEDGIGETETLIFVAPLGKIKLVMTTRPVILDKKVVGAHRRGLSKGQYEYIYSDTETTRRLEAFQEKDGEWVIIDSSIF
ncbi:MAG: hypothetical protein VE96_C0021G0007 [candidate division Kazan bacterium GW2011_GWA1_44_22]|uniref:Uncharacterized protein n=1 Tax=candidate division Kazan bacterium GW2011_GWA1_44_22 TaxID=1620410 RepID=A0A0G1I025_UNCK3|nr:MAG: hypothetical protein VE96_C0021G0007 [candidate division Kazan bacterium GW2011_GWA1_44_22]